jgi:hypothetical protein
VKIEWAQFFIKYSVIAISSLWLLFTGTDYINKKRAALELKNERLSKHSIGIAEHFLLLNDTYKDELWGGEGNLCTISGKYIIKNTGELPISFDSVVFSIYALPPTDESELDEKGIVSKTISLELDRLEPLKTESINILERVGINGQLERLYNYTLLTKPKYLYVVVANASGGLSTTKGSVDESNMFGVRELEHIVVGNICSFERVDKKE